MTTVLDPGADPRFPGGINSKGGGSGDQPIIRPNFPEHCMKMSKICGSCTAEVEFEFPT